MWRTRKHCTDTYPGTPYPCCFLAAKRVADLTNRINEWEARVAEAEVAVKQAKQAVDQSHEHVLRVGQAPQVL